MTHWQVAKLFAIGSFLGACAFAGWITAGLIYF